MEIIQYKNLRVIEEFSVTHSVSLEYSEICFHECLKFLSLVKYSNQSIQPSILVDGIWHIFITHTKDYREFCKKYIGFFVDHLPCDPNPVFFDNTIKLLHKHYGSINTIWGLTDADVENIISGTVSSKELVLSGKFASSDCYIANCGPSHGGCEPKKEQGGCFLFAIIGLMTAFLSVFALLLCIRI
ncbi:MULTISPECIES: hypothetical protein [unclassified Chryseobacterium]|uniref:hypothetical protein n=1 Tax=unclassified Chryseobacterium TaxID=2593645 RepID=UPI000D3AC020|nr:MULTISPECIES: hypothetical protein [unclassified Chryseobacterium]PTT76395.1 hypothetical protein DBR25_06055 [Chryseobacterium sp. HMWF001]PVV50429.1 hypothetical protein DD829_22460 [Chryseobacterium sp. HMWF035]